MATGQVMSPGEYFKYVKTRFEAEPADEQVRLRAEAASMRRTALAQPSPLDTLLADVDGMDIPRGPWGLATRAQEALPLRPSAVRTALSGTSVDAVGKAWRAEYAEHAVPLEGFPATVTQPRVCVGGCSADLRSPANEGSVFLPEVAQLLDYIQLAVRFATTTPKDPHILLRFTAKDDANAALGDGDAAPIVQFVLVMDHSYDNKASLFEATVCPMCSSVSVPSGATDSLGSPLMLLRLRTRPNSYGLWPDVSSELQLVRELLAQAKAWDIDQVLSRWVPSPVLGPTVRLVKGFQALRRAELEERKEQVNAGIEAVKNLRLLMGRPSERGRGHGRRHRGRGSGGRGRGRGRCPGRAKISDTSDDGSVESASSNQDSEVEHYWQGVLQGLVKKGGRCATSAHGVAGSALVDGASGGGGSGKEDTTPKPKPKAKAKMGFNQWKEAQDAAEAAEPKAPPPPVPPPTVRREQAPRRKRDNKAWVPAVGGEGGVYLDPYKDYMNWQFKCARCPDRHGCEKHKKFVVGDLQPLAFLHAWHDVEPRAGKTHRNSDPTPEAVATYLAAHGAGLGDLYTLLSGRALPR